MRHDARVRAAGVSQALKQAAVDLSNEHQELERAAGTHVATPDSPTLPTAERHVRKVRDVADRLHGMVRDDSLAGFEGLEPTVREHIKELRGLADELEGQLGKPLKKGQSFDHEAVGRRISEVVEGLRETANHEDLKSD